MQTPLHIVRLDATAPSSAAAIVLLHGFMGSHYDWRHLGGRLAACTNRPCYGVDLPGHGNSALPERDLSLTFVGELLAESLTIRGLVRPTLVGYSLGGRVALAAALNGLELSSLALESAHPGLVDPDLRAKRASIDHDRAVALESDFAEFLDRWYTMPLFASLADDPDRLRRIKGERLRGDPAQLARVVAELSPGRQPALWDQLSSLPAPTLMLVGAKDLRYVEVGRRMANEASVRCEVVTGAGHNIHEEQPRAWLDHVVAFVRP